MIVLVVFGYKKLPQLGRSAGKGLRSARESAKELSTTVGDKVGEKASGIGEKTSGKFDPSEIGKSAGKGLREAREFKDALTGKGEFDSTTKSRAAAKPTPPAAETADAPPPAETVSAEEPATGEAESAASGSGASDSD